MHKIKPGQTLGHIAEIYKVKTNSIRTLNNVRDNNIRTKYRLIKKSESNSKNSFLKPIYSELIRQTILLSNAVYMKINS
jgi:LysM repeat protein